MGQLLTSQRPLESVRLVPRTDIARRDVVHTGSTSAAGDRTRKNVSISGELDVKRIEKAGLLPGTVPTTLAYAPAMSWPSVPTRCTFSTKMVRLHNFVSERNRLSQ
jgi:hypothetical protein